VILSVLADSLRLDPKSKNGEVSGIRVASMPAVAQASGALDFSRLAGRAPRSYGETDAHFGPLDPTAREVGVTRRSRAGEPRPGANRRNGERCGAQPS
jgi:hypothetical protein